MNEWPQELSEALKYFREKLLAEEVEHQYYKNLSNKVNTVVLVTYKTGYIEWMNLAAINHLGQYSTITRKSTKGCNYTQTLLYFNRKRTTPYQLIKNAHETCSRKTNKNIEIKISSHSTSTITLTVSDNGE